MIKLETSKKFIIISYCRTGSNFLVSLLDSHPDIKCDGELLGKVTQNPDYLKILKKIFNDTNKTQGFKLFHYHPVNVENNQLLFETIKADKSIRIIFLERKNLLRRYYSLLKARQTKVWKVTNPKDITKIKLHVDINQLTKSIDSVTYYENLYKQMFHEHKHIIIQYEDIENNYTQICVEIFRFLELNNYNVIGNTIKQNPGTTKDLIENYSELDTYFKLNSHPRVILD